MFQKQINDKWQKIHEYRSLLNRTDYQDHRSADEDTPMQAEIKEARKNAREQINLLEDEIADLELQQEAYLKTIDDIEL